MIGIRSNVLDLSLLAEAVLKEGDKPKNLTGASRRKPRLQAWG
jgi:hypothetical protein